MQTYIIAFRYVFLYSNVLDFLDDKFTSMKKL